jgi:hypothetical protein
MNVGWLATSPQAQGLLAITGWIGANRYGEEASRLQPGKIHRSHPNDPQ